MSLEINHNDSSMDTRQINNHRPAFQRTIAGLLTTMMLFSGSLIGPTTVYATETPTTSLSQSADYTDPSTIIEIPETYQYEVYSLCGKEEVTQITVGDLQKASDNWLTLAVYDDASLEWLNHVGKIEHLSLIIHAEDTSIVQTLKQLKNVESLSIMSPFSSPIELNSRDFAFLKRSTNIKDLLISGEVTIEPGLLEQLTHLKSLNLYLQDGNHKYDCTKLGFLNELKLYDPYTAAVYITQDEYDSLIRNGVKVTFSEDEELKTFKEINKRLDEIVESLNIDENSTEQEKFDALICYVLDNLTYDPEVSHAIANNIDHRELTNSFYEGGLLYGAIEKDTAICGNYAALTNALAERLGIDTYYLTSHNHAWSLVEVEGEQYYVDTTWLDGQTIYKEESSSQYDEQGRVISTSISWIPTPASDAIREGNVDELDWYMENPSSYPKSETQKESHIVVNLPDFLGLTPAEESDVPPVTIPAETTPIETQGLDTTEPTEETTPIKLDEEEVELRLGEKSWIVPAAVAIGVLTAFGGAVAVKKNKDKKERERRRRQAMYSDPFADSYSPYGSGYSSYDSSYSPYGTSDSLFDDYSTQSSSKKTSRRRR